MKIFLENEKGDIISYEISKELLSSIPVNIRLEVTNKVFDEISEILEEEEKREKHESYEYSNHRVRKSLEDYSIFIKAATPCLEETFFYKKSIQQVQKVLNKCSPIQRRRFLLYYVYGYTLEEIANMERCHLTVVQKSIKAVLRKILKSF